MTLSVGQPAPTFTLPSSDGGTLALDDLRGTIVVLYFYPKDNTPGCTIEAQDFRDAMPALRELGATVLGVSKDSIASHCKFRDKFQLGFPLLTDADGAVMDAYGAWGEKMMYGKPMVGVIRSTVLIDRDGQVVRHWPKVSVKGHAADVVAAVRELTGAPAASEPAQAPAAAPAAAPARKPAAARAPTRTPVAAKARPKAKPATKGKAKVAAVARAASKKAATPAKKGAAKTKPGKKVGARPPASAKKSAAKKPARKAAKPARRR